MRILLVLAIFLGFSDTRAQVMGRFYYNDQWELTLKDSAKYVRMCVYDTARDKFVGPVRDMFRSGKPQMTGTYRGGVKNGEFTFYHENGNVQCIGYYSNNLRVGTWKYFHPNGKPDKEVAIDVVYWTILSAFDSTGAPMIQNGVGQFHEEYYAAGLKPRVIVDGYIKGGVKNGKWECRLSTGELVYSELYSNGLLIESKKLPDVPEAAKNISSTDQFPEPFKLEATETFLAASYIPASTYPNLPYIFRGNKMVRSVKRSNPANTKYSTEQREIVYDKVDEPPAPLGGIAAFYADLNRILRPQTDAKNVRISGKVVVDFVVRIDGSITDPRIRSSLHPNCDKEAIRCITLVSQTRNWSAGTVNGEPVAVRMVLPVSFR